MSLIKILVHSVWTTKNRIPYLRDEIRDEVIYHIRGKAKSSGIFIDHINGYTEHLHALISMGCRQNISEIMQVLKGESSFWINKNKLTKNRFAWQDDYYCVSIGIHQLDTLRGYIRNQVEHHRKVSLQEELDQIIEEYGLQLVRD